MPPPGRFGCGVQAVDMPVEFQVDERDDLPRFACGNQDHPAIAGTPVLLLGIPASGNPRLHLFSRVIGPGHVADGAVEDIGHAGGIQPLIIPDDYFSPVTPAR